jgi:hypothetical protein
MGGVGGVVTDEVADLVQHNLLLVDGGQACLVDDEVLALGLDEQAVRASGWQSRSRDVEGATAQLTEPFAQDSGGELFVVG